MIADTKKYIEMWDSAVNGDGIHAMNEFLGKIDNISNASGLNFETMSENLSNYKDIAQKVANATTNIIDKIGNSLDSINEATKEWNAHASMLEAVQKGYENIALSAQNAIKVLSGFNTSNNINTLSGLITFNEAQAELASNYDFSAITSQMALDMEAYLSSWDQLASASLSSNIINHGSIEQNIQITAEFPNVSDSNEIKIAFDDLLNLAT
jgi:hypothetical protein